jgi:uncharacterized membrane protein
MPDRLSLASSTGLPLALLAFHAAMGTVGLVSGTIAMIARKGGAWHRRSGLIFVYTMIAMGVSAVGVSVYEGKADVAGGAAAAYLILTAWTTITPLPGGGRWVDGSLLLLPLLFAVGGFINGFEAMSRPGRHIDGVPAAMLFFLAAVFSLAVIGDVRMIRDGGIQGTRRLARHLWRMCFGLFIATGSFIAQLVKMSFMPEWTRSVPVIVGLALGPLIVLIYWMWRIRIRNNLKGLRLLTAVSDGF